MTNNVTVNKNFPTWNDVASNNQRYTRYWKVMNLRRQLFFERKENKEPKLSINLVVLLFGSIYVYVLEYVQYKFDLAMCSLFS